MKRNIERFPSKQMYPYLSLVERKEAEFYHNIDRGRYINSIFIAVATPVPDSQHKQTNKHYLGQTTACSGLAKGKMQA